MARFEERSKNTKTRPESSRRGVPGRAQRRQQRRQARHKWQLLVLAAFCLTLTGLGAVVLLGTGDGGGKDATATASSSTTEPGPYDFAEASGDTSLDGLADSKFISVTIQDPNGIRAYSVSPERAEFASLVELLPGRPIDLNLPFRSEATVTFVSQERSTVTFELDLSQRVGMRGDKAWELAPAVGDVLRRLQTSDS